MKYISGQLEMPNDLGHTMKDTTLVCKQRTDTEARQGYRSR